MEVEKTMREKIIDAFVADAILAGFDNDSVRYAVEFTEGKGGSHMSLDPFTHRYFQVEKFVGEEIEARVYLGGGKGNFYRWVAKKHKTVNLLEGASYV